MQEIFRKRYAKAEYKDIIGLKIATSVLYVVLDMQVAVAKKKS